MPYRINMFKLYENYPHTRLINIHSEMDTFVLQENPSPTRGEQLTMRKLRVTF